MILKMQTSNQGEQHKAFNLQFCLDRGITPPEVVAGVVPMNCLAVVELQQDLSRSPAYAGASAAVSRRWQLEKPPRFMCQRSNLSPVRTETSLESLKPQPQAQSRHSSQ